MEEVKFEKLKDIEGAQDQLNTLHLYCQLIQSYNERKVHLYVVDKMPDQCEADQYYWDKATEKLWYSNSKNENFEIGLKGKNFFKPVLNIEVNKKGNSILLDEETKNKLFNNNTGTKDSRITLTKQAITAFQSVYTAIHHDLSNDPDKLEGYKVVLDKMNALAMNILSNASPEALAQDIHALGAAVDNFGVNNLIDRKPTNQLPEKPQDKAIPPKSPAQKVRVALATFIGLLIGTLVGAGVAALTTFLTVGFGAPAGILAGIFVGGAVGGAIVGALSGQGIGRLRQGFLNRKADKEHEKTADSINEENQQAQSQYEEEVINIKKENHENTTYNNRFLGKNVGDTVGNAIKRVTVEAQNVRPNL